MTDSIHPLPRRTVSPLTAFVLALLGNVAVIALLAATAVTVLVSAVVVFGGELLGLG